MTDSTQQATDLDSLFQAARASEPELTDSNFTKLVLNQLPGKVEQPKPRNWLPDGLGLLTAVIAIFVFSDMARLSTEFVSALPSEIIVSLPNIALIGIA